MGERWQNAVTLPDFGGEYTLPGSEQCTPSDHSARVRNCLLYPGRVTYRPGFQGVITLGTTTVGMHEFMNATDLGSSLLISCSDGSLRKLTFGYSSSTIANSGDLYQSALTSMRLKGETLYGRAWLAFTQSGFYGEVKPVVYDGTSLIPVSPAGPGESGSVADSGSAGSIAAGAHQMRVVFTTKWGYLSPPGPAVSWTSVGSRKGSVTNIPVGPSYVDGRILAFSAVDDTDLYYVPGTSSGMVIADNTTTTATVDFTDTQLLAGVPISVATDPDSDLLNLIELPACKWVGSYHGRLCWLAERSNLGIVGDVGFRSLSFNGGFSGNRPLGWAEKIAGESKGSGLTGAHGDYLTITGNGAGVRGLLSNLGLAANSEPVQHHHASGIADYRVGLIPANKNVWIRIRARKESLTTGRFYAYLAGTTDVNTFLPAGGNYLELDQANFSSTEWQIIEGTLFTGFAGASTAELRICAGKPDTSTNLFNNGGKLHIDYIEIAFSDNKWNSSIARWSKAGQPDAYDGTTGFQLVAPDNGQRLMAAFELNDAWYYVKERSMWVTRDDGSSEPANWPIYNVSRTVGTNSLAGVAYGDQWVAIAAADGLYYFDGGRPICLSDNVRGTWLDATPGAVHVDIYNKRILVGVSASADNGFQKRVFVFQWYGASPLSGEMRFGQWTLPSGVSLTQFANTFLQGGNLPDQLACGFGTGNRILKMDDTAHDDWGNAIAQTYRTSYIGDSQNRKLFKGIRPSVRGNGTLAFNTYFPDSTTAVPQPPQTLPATTIQDKEWPFIKHHGDRFAAEFSTNAVGCYFSIEKLAALVIEDPSFPQRNRE